MSPGRAASGGLDPLDTDGFLPHGEVARHSAGNPEGLIIPFANFEVPAGTIGAEQKELIVHRLTELYAEIYGGS